MSLTPYSSSIVSLMYPMVSLRSDTAHVVNVRSKCLPNLGKSHSDAIKWNFRYLRGKSRLCLSFEGCTLIHKVFFKCRHGPRS